MLPVVAGQGDQLGVAPPATRWPGRCRPTSSSSMRATCSGLPWCSTTLHLREAPAQQGHRAGQHVARLRVGGGDRQRAGCPAWRTRRRCAQVVDLAQDASRSTVSTCSPGSVTRRRRLPWRAKMSTPSSSSSSRMALLTPGCEVCSALAVSVRLRLRRTASCTKRNWCRFIDQRPSAASRGRWPWRRSPQGSSPTGGCSVQCTAGCAARRPSSSSGRSRRTWPPAPRNSGSTVTHGAAGGDQFGAGCRQVRRHELQKGQPHRQAGERRAHAAPPRPRRARPSAGRARRGRTGSGRRIGQRRFIGSAPARRRRPATAAGRAGWARPTTSQGVQVAAARRCGPATLFSSTKLMPSMMPPKTFRLTPPARACR